MQKSFPYEIVAVVLALLGAFLLVAVYYPVINPGQFKLDSHQEDAPLSRYILGTPISLLILSASWYFNRKAQRLKRESKDSDTRRNSKPPA